MIGYISGTVKAIGEKKITILTSSGIGYDVNYGFHCEVEKPIELYTHHSISENDQSLWGFQDHEQKRFFELLKTVNKVGPSKAYPLITQVGIESLSRAISFEEVSVLTKAPGIGKKMAEQIILSLKDKIQKSEFIPTTSTVDSSPLFNNNASVGEAILALESLGYKDKDISDHVKRIANSGVTEVDQILKQVLREL